MKENILIFRSAQDFIVKNLIDKTDSKKNNIYLIIQAENGNYFKERYGEDIKYVQVNNGFFSYKDLNKDNNIKHILNKHFNKIIIPSSLEHFNGYEEIEKLILKLKYDEVIFSNKLGDFETVKVDSFKLFLKIIEKKYNTIFYIKLLYFSFIKIFRKIFLTKYNNSIIIHIFATKAIGGSERRFLRAVNYMYENNMNKNFEIYVMLQGNKDSADILINKFCSFKDIKFIYTSNDYETLNKIKEYKPKIFHMTEFLEKEYKMFRLIRKLVKNFIISITDTNKLYYSEYLSKPIFIKMLKLVKAIDCLYPSKVSILKNICLNEKYVVSTSNSFIDLHKFQPSYNKQNLIVFAARMQKFKNPILALESINLAKKVIRKHNYKCLFLGEGPETGKISELIKKYELDDIVKLKGYVDTAEYLPIVKIFLSLQEVENYPSQSLLEAIACGNYIIASNVGDTKIILTDQFSSLVELKANCVAKEIENTILKYEEQYFSNNVINTGYEFAENNFKIESFCNYLYEFWNKYND